MRANREAGRMNGNIFPTLTEKGIDSMIGWKRGDERRVGGASSLSAHTKMGEQKRKKCHIFKFFFQAEKFLELNPRPKSRSSSKID